MNGLHDADFWVIPIRRKYANCNSSHSRLRNELCFKVPVVLRLGEHAEEEYVACRLKSARRESDGRKRGNIIRPSEKWQSRVPRTRKFAFSQMARKLLFFVESVSELRSEGKEDGSGTDKISSENR